MTQLSPEQEARFEELYENTMSMFFSREQKKERLRKHLASEISLALAAREKEIEELCEYVIAKDKTREYGYSHDKDYIDREGTPPAIGSRWKTPAQYCRDVLASLRSPKEDKPKE